MINKSERLTFKPFENLGKPDAGRRTPVTDRIRGISPDVVRVLNKSERYYLGITADDLRRGGVL